MRVISPDNPIRVFKNESPSVFPAFVLIRYSFFYFIIFRGIISFKARFVTVVGPSILNDFFPSHSFYFFLYLSTKVDWLP